MQEAVQTAQVQENLNDRKSRNDWVPILLGAAGVLGVAALAASGVEPVRVADNPGGGGGSGRPPGGRVGETLGLDTDGDGLGDDLEIEYGLNPTKADTDGDNIPDRFELFTLDELATMRSVTSVRAMNEIFVGEEDIGEMSPDDFMDKVTNLKDNLDFEKLFGVSYEDLAKLRKEEQRAIIWGRTNEVEKMASEWSVITLDDVKSNLPDFKPRNFDGDADPDFDDLDSDNDGQIDAAESVDMQDKLIEELINEIMGGGISGMFDDTLDKIKLYKSSVSKMSDLYKYLNIDLYKSLFDQNNDGEQDWADTPVVNSGGNGSRPGGTGTQP